MIELNEEMTITEQVRDLDEVKKKRAETPPACVLAKHDVLNSDTLPLQVNRGANEIYPSPPLPTTIQTIQRPRTFMNHTYHDYSNIPAPDGYTITSNILNMTFVQKVHHILTVAQMELKINKSESASDVSKDEFSRCISWRSHGRAFIITTPKLLESTVLPKYFGHGRYSSFLRQLSNHGFRQISVGIDRNCHYHDVSTSLHSFKISFVLVDS
jgi:HSF-type DNA-binding